MCPVYCGAQNTFYVGNLKGVWRIYQQTFIDIYAEVACAKLYDRKTIAAWSICGKPSTPRAKSAMCWSRPGGTSSTGKYQPQTETITLPSE
jgi:hypothetical protein